MFKSLLSVFSSYRDRDLDSPMDKVDSISYDNLLRYWINNVLVDDFYVILSDINVSKKSTDFWLRIPKYSAIKFNEDVVVLRCKDKKEAIRLCESIDEHFAKAYLVDHGIIIYDNSTLNNETECDIYPEYSKGIGLT